MILSDPLPIVSSINKSVEETTTAQIKPDDYDIAVRKLKFETLLRMK
jgi:hypothetical protein